MPFRENYLEVIRDKAIKLFGKLSGFLVTVKSMPINILKNYQVLYFIKNFPCLNC